MRVLFVANENTANSELHQELIDAGFEVDRAINTRSAVSLTCANDYNLMIADDALRDLDGVMLIRHLRATGNVAPTLLLANSELALEQIVASGVDDVLLKSSTPADRLERVQALLRTFASSPRSELPQPPVADLKADTTRRTVYRDRRLLQLTRASHRRSSRS